MTGNNAHLITDRCKLVANITYNKFSNKMKVLQKFSTSLQNRRHFSIKNNAHEISIIHNISSLSNKKPNTDGCILKAKLYIKQIYINNRLTLKIRPWLDKIRHFLTKIITIKINYIHKRKTGKINK